MDCPECGEKIDWEQRKCPVCGWEARTDVDTPWGEGSPQRDDYVKPPLSGVFEKLKRLFR